MRGLKIEKLGQPARKCFPAVEPGQEAGAGALADSEKEPEIQNRQKVVLCKFTFYIKVTRRGHRCRFRFCPGAK